MLKISNNLEGAILNTITYYDIFDYPLTSFEIWNWLFDFSADLKDVIDCLDNNEYLKKYIERKNGFYFLKGRQNLLLIRKQHRDISVMKWSKALRVINILKFIPFVRMVAFCNSFGYFNVSENSDIDLFIIVKNGRLWMTRFFVTLVTQVLGVRRHDNKIKDRLCLSFYTTDEYLDLESLKYDNDVYFYNWFLHLVPIFNDGIYQEFIQKNIWVKNFLPQFLDCKIVNNWRVMDTKFSKNSRIVKEAIINIFFVKTFNLFFKKIQLLKMKSNDSVVQEKNTNVVINDNILKFHEEDKRKYYRDMFLERISKY